MAQPLAIHVMYELILAEYRIDRSEIMSNTRHERVVIARERFCWVLRQKTTMSFPEIARAMGRRSHGIAFTACQRVEAKRDEDAKYQAELDALAEVFEKEYHRIRVEIRYQKQRAKRTKR